jgi:uncharacterized membrane protein
MNLDPLLNAPFVLQLHVALACCAVLLAIPIFSMKRGTPLHKALGRLWVGSMALVALSSFFIFELRLIGPFSPIHLLSVYVLVQLYLSIRAVRRGDIRRHQQTMKSMSFWGLVVAGAFTFMPGRTMHTLLSGG